MALSKVKLIALILQVFALYSLTIRHSLLAHNTAMISIQAVTLAAITACAIKEKTLTFKRKKDPSINPIITIWPYKQIRYPKEALLLVFIIISASNNLSVPVMQLSLLFAVGTYMRIGLEEQKRLGEFPGYAEYAAATKKLIPSIW